MIISPKKDEGFKKCSWKFGSFPRVLEHSCLEFLNGWRIKMCLAESYVVLKYCLEKVGVKALP